MAAENPIGKWKVHSIVERFVRDYLRFHEVNGEMRTSGRGNYWLESIVQAVRHQLERAREAERVLVQELERKLGLIEALVPNLGEEEHKQEALLEEEHKLELDRKLEEEHMLEQDRKLGQGHMLE